MLSPRAARDLADRFLEIRHVREFGLTAIEDTNIRSFAAKNGYAVVTKDSDYLDLLARYGHPPKIVHLGFGNCSNAVLVRTLDAYRDAIEALWSSDDGVLRIRFPVRP